MAKVWMPVPDDFYFDDNLAVSYDGKDIGFRIDNQPHDGDDWANNYEWLGDSVESGLPSDIRLCRLVEVEQPDAPAVPDEIREIFVGLIDYFKQMHSFLRERDRVEIDQIAMARADKALAWLSALGQEA